MSSQHRQVPAYVDPDGSLMVQIHPMFPCERARKATRKERLLDAASGDEGWFLAEVSARTMAKLESIVRDEEGY